MGSQPHRFDVAARARRCARRQFLGHSCSLGHLGRAEERAGHGPQRLGPGLVVRGDDEGAVGVGPTGPDIAQHDGVVVGERREHPGLAAGVVVTEEGQGLVTEGGGEVVRLTRVDQLGVSHDRLSEPRRVAQPPSQVRGPCCQLLGLRHLPLAGDDHGQGEVHVAQHPLLLHSRPATRRVEARQRPVQEPPPLAGIEPIPGRCRRDQGRTRRSRRVADGSAGQQQVGDLLGPCERGPFHDRAGGPTQGQQSRRGRRRFDRAPGDAVGEPEGGLRLSVQQLGFDGQRRVVHGILHRSGQHRRGHPDVELLPKHGAGEDQVACADGQEVHPPSDEIADRAGNRRGVHLEVLRLAGELDQVEGAPAALREDPVDVHRPSVGSDPVTDDAPCGRPVDAAELELQRVGHTRQVGEEGADRVRRRGDLVRTGRQDEQHRPRRPPLEHPAEGLDRRRVGPLDIVQQHHRRRPPAGALHRTSEGGSDTAARHPDLLR